MPPREPAPLFNARISALVQQTVLQFSGQCTPSDAWSPDVNVYQLADRLEVCVDLAGVDREKIKVQVVSGQLLIEGERSAPEPPREPSAPMRIVSMEIDFGPFRRVISLPAGVRLDRVESSYIEGLLWIRLPLKPTND